MYGACFWCRYCLAVNIIAFVYSGFQVIKAVHQLISKKYIVRRPKEYVFEFSVDQASFFFFFFPSERKEANFMCLDCRFSIKASFNRCWFNLD